MKRIYPNPDQAIPRWRLFGLFVIVLFTILWALHSWWTGDERLQNRIIMVACGVFLTSLSLAQRFWPVVSIGENSIVVHRHLWFSKIIPFSAITAVDHSDSNLYISISNSRSLSFDLAAIDHADRETVFDTVESRVSILATESWFDG